MSWLVTDAAHWALALIPVLVMLAIFIWLDAFALMSLREVTLLLLAGGLGASPHGRSAGVSSTRCRSAFPSTAGSSRPGSKRRSRP